MNEAHAPTTSALLRSAQSLAARGWLVFPCVPGGKRPALRGNWKSHATADPAQIRAWWTRAPYNIGIACGPSGLVVIDLDVCRGQCKGQTASGADALAALCKRHGQPDPLPTYTVDTPSGGHLYYATRGDPVRNSAGRLGPHIDIRASGGYVVGAGSRIGGRVYSVVDDRSPAPLPWWIAALLCDVPVVAARRSPLVLNGVRGTAYAMAALREEAQLVATARHGARNDALNRAAFNLGQLAVAGLIPPLAVISALASAAERAGLPDGEAARTIMSGLSAGTRHPRAERTIGGLRG